MGRIQCSEQQVPNIRIKICNYAPMGTLVPTSVDPGTRMININNTKSEDVWPFLSDTNRSLELVGMIARFLRLMPTWQ
jgi:hypothetical protein